MPPAEPATSILIPESQCSPELETKFLTCLVNPPELIFSDSLWDVGWPRAEWGSAKDTGFFSVGHSSRAAPDDVAVEGDF